MELLWESSECRVEFPEQDLSESEWSEISEPESSELKFSKSESSELELCLDEVGEVGIVRESSELEVEFLEWDLSWRRSQWHESMEWVKFFISERVEGFPWCTMMTLMCSGRPE